MKIAILSDIHGNIYALERVMEEARREGVKTFFILGDLVGYYYYPLEVIELLSANHCFYIKGNHEEMLENVSAGTLQISQISDKYGHGHEFALQQLSSAQLDELKALQTSDTVTIDNLSFSLHHGAPFDKGFYLYPDASIENLERCDSKQSSFVFCGHSHYAFMYRNRHSTLVNPGSVGQNRVTGGLASWAIIHTDNQMVELRSTPYNITRLLKDTQRYDPTLTYLSTILKRNHS